MAIEYILWRADRGQRATPERERQEDSASKFGVEAGGKEVFPTRGEIEVKIMEM